MSIGYPPRKPPQQHDEFLAALSPLLEEAAGLESHRTEANDLLLLLEENARLRKLAVKLSNLLGDLPERAGEIRSESQDDDSMTVHRAAANRIHGV